MSIDTARRMHIGTGKARMRRMHATEHPETYPTYTNIKGEASVSFSSDRGTTWPDGARSSEDDPCFAATARLWGA